MQKFYDNHHDFKEQNIENVFQKSYGEKTIGFLETHKIAVVDTYQLWKNSGRAIMDMIRF